VDRDGDLDIFLLLDIHQFTPLRLWKNDGKGRFTDVSATQLPLLTANLFLGLPADVNGDGYPDLVFSPLGGGPWLYLNDGKGNFYDATQARFGALTHKWMMALSVGDVDGDQDIDIVSGGGYGTGTRIWINNGNGYFTEESATRLPNDQGIYSTGITKLIDLDCDGDLDLYLGNGLPYPSGSNCRVYVNDGSGKFQDDSARWYPTYTAEPMYSCEFADLDDDGDPDLLFARANSYPPPANQNRIYFNTFRHLYAPNDAVRGQPYPVELHGEPKEVAVLLLGLAYQRIPAGDLGVLGPDLAASVVLPGATQLPSSGTATVPLQIPPIPTLLGQNVYTQAFFLNYMKPSRSGLSNTISDTVR
jgi:hypothetical protein